MYTYNPLHTHHTNGSVTVYAIIWAPPVAVVKNPPAMQEMQETQVSSLGREDLLEEGMATLSSILV